MAIKLSKEGTVLKVTPHFKQYFDIASMEDAISGWPEPMKIGPIWVIQNENVLKSPDNLNDLASRFFHIPIYGDVLILSSHELPKEWDLIDDSDLMYTADEIDAGFVKSLSEMAIFENLYIPYNQPYEPDFINSAILQKPQQVEYTYSPEKQVKNDDEFKEFLRNAYTYVISSAPEFKSFVVYEDELNIVKVNAKKDMLKTIDQMLAIFVEDESYEKAAKLRDLRPIIEEKISE
jgi:hypothetical protein